MADNYDFSAPYDGVEFSEPDTDRVRGGRPNKQKKDKTEKTMTKKTRNVLIHTAAGVAAAVLVLFGIKECRDADSARAERDNARAALVNNEEAMRESKEALADTRDALNDMTELAEELAAEKQALRDSLDDCRNGKKNRTTCKRCQLSAKKPVKKPVAKKTVVSQTVRTVCDEKPAKCVKQTVVEPAETTVEIKDDAHNNVVNVNNGIINNNYYNAPADTAKTQQAAIVWHTVTRRRVSGRCR